MTDEKALTVAKEKALEVRAQEELDAMLAEHPDILKMWSHGDIDEGDMAQPPYLKLAQKPDPDHDIEAGVYYNTLTWKVYGPSVEVVPLINLVKTRAEYFRPYTKNKPPYCASDDFDMPRKSTDRRPLLDPKPGPCASCPSAQWERSDGGDIPALCSEQHNFMVAPIGEWDKLRIMWQRTGTKMAKTLRAIMAGSGILKTCVISATFLQTDKGDYWVPIVTEGRRLKITELAQAAAVKLEADNMIKEGLWQIGADEEVDFNESNGYVADAAPEQEEEDMLF